jgi:hypothetical protein
MRQLGRAANQRAAEVPDPHAATREERLAEIHFRSAACFEAAAVAAAGLPYDIQTRRVREAVAHARSVLAERQTARI